MKLVKNTIGHLLLDRLKKTPNKKAIGFVSDGKITNFSFLEYKKKIEALSLAMLKKGIINQDKVCLLSQTRIEWNYCDLSILCAGAITVPIYHTYSSDEVFYILSHSGAKMIIVENNLQFKKLLPIIDQLPDLKFIIAMDKIKSSLSQKISSHIEFYQYSDFYDYGVQELISNPDTFEIKINSLHDDNIATIIYTSGTTGEPKGAVITQGSLTKMLSNIKSFTNCALSENDTNLSFLPLSHVLGRCDSLLNLTFGCETIYAESMENLLENIALVKPTFMIAVPRIFEKIYEKVQADLSAANPLKKGIFDWAMNASNTYFEKIENNKTPTAKDIIQFNLSKKLVTNKIYEKFGGKIRYFISGGAPLSEEIIKFLRNSSLTLIEGYGLTETIAPCVLNPFERQKPGTVGKPIGDVEIRFALDGEILVRSKALFSYYLNNEKETALSMDKEGWFHTGDIGSFDSDGYLLITDRKKDIIITSGGKNIAPQKIEGLLKISPIVDQCVIVGDKQKYLTALISLNDENLTRYLDDQSQVSEIIQTDIDLINSKLAPFETIKRFSVLPVELTTDNYLTPSLKVKKKLILKDFKNQIDTMYND